jgi:hypothetical protein
MMNFLTRLGKLDRRWIFLLILATSIIPLLLSLQPRFFVDSPTRSLYDYIDGIEPGGRPLMISFDYDPQVAPELDPMARAILRHCFARGVGVVGLSFAPQGDAIGEAIITQMVREQNGMRRERCKDTLAYGRDYCFFGFRPAGTIVMLLMGQDIHRALPADNYRNPIDSLPMMDRVRNYDDISIVMSLAGSSWTYSWIIFANTRFGAKVGAGQTAVMAPENYPFLQTGQLVGQLGGMKGAAEYEQLIADAGYYPKRDMASRAMNAVSFSHLMIIALIVLGNVGYFAGRRREGRKP